MDLSFEEGVDHEAVYQAGCQETDYEPDPGISFGFVDEYARSADGDGQCRGDNQNDSCQEPVD